MAILVAEFACAEEDYNLKAMLLSTTLLMSGLTTLAQVNIDNIFKIMCALYLFFLTFFRYSNIDKEVNKNVKNILFSICDVKVFLPFTFDGRGNNKMIELPTILQRESQNT
jgi:hypothetical protein